MNKKLQEIINELSSMGEATDADNLRRAWNKFARSHDRTMMDQTTKTGILILERRKNEQR